MNKQKLCKYFTVLITGKINKKNTFLGVENLFQKIWMILQKPTWKSVYLILITLKNRREASKHYILA